MAPVRQGAASNKRDLTMESLLYARTIHAQQPYADAGQRRRDHDVSPWRSR